MSDVTQPVQEADYAPRGVAVEIVEDGEELTETRYAGSLLSEEQRGEVIELIEDELSAIRNERAQLLETRQRWRLQLDNTPNSKLPGIYEPRRRKPFTNTANTSVPLIPMLVQTLFAQLMSTFNRTPFWTALSHQTDTPEHHEQGKMITKYLRMQAEGAQDLALERVKRNAFMESAPMGTVFYKVIWNRESIHYQSEQREQEIDIHHGPKVLVVDYEHMLFRDTYRDFQELPFLAHAIPLSKTTFRQRVAQGIYGEEEKVLAALREAPTSDEQSRAKGMGVEDSGKPTVDLLECYLYYDADGDGILEDLVVTYHEASQCFVRVTYNDFGLRPFVPATHVHRTNRITGIGVCEMLEYSAIEMNSLNNLFLDNVKLANSMIVTRRRGALTKERDLHVNAGGPTVIDVEESDDVKVWRFGEIYPSLVEAQDRLFQYAMRLVGVNEAMAGFPSMQLGSRDTGMGQQQRLSQGASILATIARSHEEALSEVGRMVFLRLMQHRQEVIDLEAQRGRLTTEELTVLSRALTPVGEELSPRTIFHVETTGADQTVEAQKQNLFALNTLYAQYTQAVTELLSALFGPQHQQLLQAAPELYMRLGELFIGTTQLMKENFEFFGKTNEEEYLPDTEMLKERLETLQEALGGIADRIGGSAGSSGMAGGAGAPRGPVPGDVSGTRPESLLEGDA